MNNYKRRRKSANEDLQKATKAVERTEMARLNLWIPKQDYDKIKIDAIKRNVSVSDILRALINNYVS